ncbi:hypothetical protein CPB84DRAFT_1686278 [Gymnopilus junonius]|uniref:MYND-type domain-containing protein n=1 Tax=Gymnopilus junonius TaxID=109634 RepID=A0A9P5TI36_GYMJU|nr:hypothetical protein CPB84DRAFT_1686278 [Gymnopilus junonius]
MFQIQQTWPNEGGSDVERWFRKVTQGTDAIRSWGNNKRQYSRLISWKKGKEFAAENLFFRTIDTSRLLPMSLADFRFQWYTHQGIWNHLDKKKVDGEFGPRKQWQYIALSGLMWYLLVMRNMHDYGCGDIAMVVTEWTSEEMDMALDYWAELSQDKWTPDEKREKFFEMDRKLHNSNPCFYQNDLLVRSLLSDPAVGYVPRLIVFMSTNAEHKARALFTDPSFHPPEALIATFPTGCGNIDCEDNDCGMFDFSKCRSLKKGSSMVRKDKFPPPGNVKCNMWVCNVEEQAGFTGPSKFQKCQKCKEALYCCKDHQAGDWASHKRVCEVPPC